MTEEKLFTDKNGIVIKDDDVLFDGLTYWRYCEDPELNRRYLLSCTIGYEHDLTKIETMERIGTFKGNEELFHCD